MNRFRMNPPGQVSASITSRPVFCPKFAKTWLAIILAPLLRLTLVGVMKAIILLSALLIGGAESQGQPSVVNVVTNADQASLLRALATGGTVPFAVDCTIPLTNAIVITTNTTLDATGHNVTLDGGNLVRHFVVTNGVSLRLVHLGLVNGRFAGALGGTDQTGEPGIGGSIYNAGGTLQLIGCAWTNNQVIGGSGGPPSNAFGGAVGAVAYGGALFPRDGQVFAANCAPRRAGTKSIRFLDL